VLLLALDTSTAQVSVAFGDGGSVLGSVQLAGGRRHAEQLAPAIAYLRDECGVSLDRLAAIAVGTGPGLFTGLRVGVTTAKVMAQALRIPVVGVPSLDLVSYPLRHSGRTIIAVLDARRREVFAARYQPVPGGVQRVSDYAVHVPAELVAELMAEPDEHPHGLLLAGDGIARFPDEFAALEHAEIAGPEFAAPSVAALVALATARAEREEFEQPGDLRSLYLRQSDAEIAWGERAGALPGASPSVPGASPSVPEAW
jgi:tRNA threonylcarbamoyladenosine biosynthesis protein TsaB